ncbi:hypothetical protein L2E82_16105 [Cichorium intybus]|uniref:Uncharacterized protein n=1 Tax=Cichorium intybus TaxID=13427 RepID=A0ACB9F531_CICIN|nr:hypothetical protein L2E82_16105 [Cichorium intybus]
MESLKLIVLLIVVGFGLIVVLTQFFASGVTRGVIVGWICLVFSLCVFVAPLGVLRQVIKTKSVEYMPIQLSVALTLSAVMWFFYGLLLDDFNIAIPNVLGFTFGIIQMILYFVYKNKKPVIDEKIYKCEEKVTELAEQKLPEYRDQKIIDVVKLKTSLDADTRPVFPENAHDTNQASFEPQALHNVPSCTIESIGRQSISVDWSSIDFSISSIGLHRISTLRVFTYSATDKKQEQNLEKQELKLIPVGSNKAEISLSKLDFQSNSVLKNGVEVKLQRNALSVLEPLTKCMLLGTEMFRSGHF